MMRSLRQARIVVSCHIAVLESQIRPNQPIFRIAQFVTSVLKGLYALHDVFGAEHLLAEEIFEHLFVVCIAVLAVIEHVVFLDKNVVAVLFSMFFSSSCVKQVAHSMMKCERCALSHQ